MIKEIWLNDIYFDKTKNHEPSGKPLIRPILELQSGQKYIINASKEVLLKLQEVINHLEKTNDRINQTEYYKKLVEAVSQRSTCDRAKVGAIIVKEKSIISTGYNGSIQGGSHCSEDGHLIVNSHCIRTIHAEVNAILTSARNGINTNGCDMFSLYKPCFRCMQTIINSGIKNCYYFNEYADEYQKEFENNKFCRFIKCAG